ncbi:hypothetical protein BD311DRAFT_752447 [Dichomitus squalens]|uniref:Uncharacterized protein n=1 Tax=Dichomitus squalens TaxID=114155 RepID=A0A4Q9MXR5_9APHY|nr:hypothetical protein BD311DRAFT_752447 [Dichomitus squalens]
MIYGRPRTRRTRVVILRLTGLFLETCFLVAAHDDLRSALSFGALDDDSTSEFRSNYPALDIISTLGRKPKL